MLTKEEFQQKIQEGIRILDGATGSNLRAAGMPKDCCTEQWVLENPEPLVTLQRAYAAAGSQIIYAPTFQAQPIALKTVGMDAQRRRRSTKRWLLCPAPPPPDASLRAT